MALAAKQGGAKGIRANSVVDIRAIRKRLIYQSLGLLNEIILTQKYILPQLCVRVDELMAVQPEIIALDATHSKRPNGETLATFFKE